ncbi:MAG: ABC transporter substrate-binding protein [Spirochaetaceae bacterium]|jgi:peptide/nickel transport system substrate-binding protein|nr:ABC transporter substrate-binding protein [Spirochaetaceae bacterium]
MKATGWAAAVLMITAVSFVSAGAQKDRAGSTGELRFGFSTEPATLDPLSPANTADGRSILFNVFEGLVKPNPDGGLEPAVAEKYAVERDGLAYNFTLREGLLFHDGTSVTAEDVVFTLETAKANQFDGFTNIDAVEVLGERNLRITLKEKDPEFLADLMVGIVPKHNANREKNAVGTGPFIIESYTTQQSLVLVKNPNYRRPGYPKLDKVTIVFVADSDALLTALRGGNIDGAVITGSLLQQLPENDFDVVPGSSNSVQLLALNNAVKPLDDVRVRRALNYAVDVREIIDMAFYGRGEPSGSPLIPGLARAYETSLKNPYPLDIARAKSLLAEAGYPNGFSLEITVPSVYVMHVDTAQVLVNQLAKAGVAVTIRQVDWATWLSDVYRDRNFQATIISLDSNSISPRSFLARYRSNAGSNFINFKSADFDSLYDKSLAEQDDAKRIAIYKNAQKLISDNAASVYIQDILGFKVFPRGRFSGVLNYPLYVTDFSTVTGTGAGN